MVVLESRTAGWAASGRNGGFCAASLTHGLRNGLERFPAEIGALERLGRENLAAIEATLVRHGIDCSWERTGELTVATAPWQLDDLREMPELARRHGGELELLDAAQVRERVDSPTYVGGLLDRTGVAMVDPARLACGLKQACLRARRAVLRELGRGLGGRHGVGARGCTRRTAWSPPAASRSAPTPSPRCSAGCAPTSPRSTTTRWSPSRCPPTSSRRSAGRAARASPTRATSSTTTG